MKELPTSVIQDNAKLAAWQQIEPNVVQMKPAIERAIRRRLGGFEGANDVAQNALQVVFIKADRLSRLAKEHRNAAILRISADSAASEVRYRMRKKRHAGYTLSLDSILEDGSDFVDPSPNPEEILMTRERLAPKMKVISRWREKAQEVFFDSAAGYTPQQIAQTRQIPKETVNQYLGKQETG